MTQTPFFTSLPDRGLLHLEGPDRHDFLQGLITNDINALTPERQIYSCLLNPQGKFLHDFFIREGESFTLLECEGGVRARDLYTRLNRYRLRADVQISVEEHAPVFAIFGEDDTQETALPDPRHRDMGLRALDKPKNLEERPFEEWDKRRIALTIPDGARDMTLEKSTMDEAQIEKLNGLSYDKGCYIGQELTARMHYRGLGKKHLHTIGFEGAPPQIEPAIGEMRSSCENVGLALLKDSAIKDADHLPFKILS